MSKEPDNLVFKMLRDMREDMAGMRSEIAAVQSSIFRVEKRVEDPRMAVTYSLGQSTHTQFRQSNQESRIDELFAKVEKLPGEQRP